MVPQNRRLVAIARLSEAGKIALLISSIRWRKFLKQCGILEKVVPESRIIVGSQKVES
jgi:hypothetical protein